MTAAERVRRAYDCIAQVDRPEIWITLRPLEDALAEAARIDAAVDAGADLPMAGRVAAVKDNIDVSGLPTTAGCPAFSYEPDASAVVVQRLTDAGAIVLGKTNLDQFATGLAGVRSPYGAVRDAVRPDHVSGGSSSGSAVAVALGIVDLALATDTAGSGRVPAAFQRIVGVKPSRGLLPLTGVVPADRQRDCVSVFARDLPDALELAALLTGTDSSDCFSRDWPATAPTGLTGRARVAVAAVSELHALTAEGRSAYAGVIARLSEVGAEVVEVDISAALETADLLYGGAFVAARYAAFGDFLDKHPADVDPTVAAIVSPAAQIPAHHLVQDEERLAVLQARIAELFHGIDALVLPTTTRQPTLAELAEDPIGANARLGVFTNFCNLLDLCAIALPAGDADGGGFGVTVFGPAFTDGVVADVAALMVQGTAGTTGAGAGPRPPGVPLAVFGAHLSGHSLNGQLAGGRLVRRIRTAPAYRMVALPTTPPKPGLVATGEGGSIEGELWSLPPSRLGELLGSLPLPMALGPVVLDTGETVTGFLCQPDALAGAEDITGYGSWPAYLATIME